MGRPVIDIAPHIDKIVNALLIGATYELAALYAGVSHDTLLRWRKKAEKAAPGTTLAQLRDRMAEAEGRAAIGWLAKIESQANQGDWKAAAWKLERRYPETYGRTFNKVALTDPSGEQPWEPTLGLAALLQVAQQQLPPSNGHLLAPPEDPEA